MSKIEINIRNVICSSIKIDEAKKETADAKTALHATACFIDSQIRARENLNQRLNQICNNISRIEVQMGRIDTVVSNGASQYRSVENQALWKAKELEEVRSEEKPERNGKQSYSDKRREFL